MKKLPKSGRRTELLTVRVTVKEKRALVRLARKEDALIPTLIYHNIQHLLARFEDAEMRNGNRSRSKRGNSDTEQRSSDDTILAPNGDDGPDAA